jgi:hypothetical protein
MEKCIDSGLCEAPGLGTYLGNGGYLRHTYGDSRYLLLAAFSLLGWTRMDEEKDVDLRGSFLTVTAPTEIV